MGLRRFVRGVPATTAVLGFAAVGPLSTAGPAHADALGSTAIGTFTYEVRGAAVKVPVGCFLTHGIDGSGKRVSGQLAGVDRVGAAAAFSRFCNWRIDFAYADTNGRAYRTARGATHAERDGAPLRRAGARTLPTYGKACVKLFVNGKLRATQCHCITK